MTALRRALEFPSTRVGRWVVIGFWLVMVGALGPLAGKLSSVEKNDATSFLPRSAESTAVNKELRAFLGNTIPTTVVYQRASGITAQDRAAVDQDREQISVRVLGGGPVPPAQASQDGQALLLNFSIPASEDGTVLQREVQTVTDIVVDGRPDGLTAKVTGAGGQLLDALKSFGGIDTTLLYATVAVVALILLVVYRSPVLWIIPLLSVGIADSLAQSLVYLLAKYGGLVVDGQSQGILTVLVFGAGTDYALLLVARYREELHNHESRQEAMALALRRTAPAIIASGLTVTIGLLCLLFAELQSTRGLGPVCAAGIVLCVVVQLSLLPALLVVFGRWVFWPLVPRYGTPTRADSGPWARMGRWIAGRPRLIWAATSLVLLVLVAGLPFLNANGLSTKDSYTTPVPSVQGAQIVAQHFPAGSSDPAYIIANAPQTEPVVAAAAGTPGVSGAAPAGPPKDGRVLLFATLADPPDSKAAADTVDRLRAAVHAVPGAGAIVGGNTAVNLDVRRASVHDRNVVIPIVLVVVFVVLAVLLSALAAPALLMLTVVLSFLAALGASAVVFRFVFGFPGTDPAVPLYAFIFLVALGIDYNIFLMTRVREEARQIGTRPGTLRGLAATGGVITSAGVVLAATFSVLAVLPLTVLVEIGFIVAFGVLLDTLVVRSILVPALVLDVGPPVWWPSRLARQPEPPLQDERVPELV